MAIRKRGRTPLACAVWLGLFAVPEVVAQQLNVSDGQEHVASGSYVSSGDFQNALSATGAGTSIVNNGVAVSAETTGNNAYAASAANGASITLTNGTLTTGGGSSHGAYANDGRLTLTNVDIVTNGVSAYGLHSITGPAGLIKLTDSSVTAKGANSHAIAAGAGRIELVGSTVVSEQANAVSINGFTNVIATNTDFRSNAGSAIFMAAASLELDGGSATAGAVGHAISGFDSTITVRNGTTLTSTAHAAIDAEDGAVTLDDVIVRSTGSNALRAYASADVTAVNTDFRSDGSNAIDVNGATLDLSGGTVVATATNWSGINGTNATISIDGNAEIESAAGTALTVKDSDLVVGNSTITGAAGIAIIAKTSTVDIAVGTVATGSSFGLYTEKSAVTADGAVLRSTTMDAAYFQGGDVNLANASLQGGRHGFQVRSGAGVMMGAATVALSDTDVVGASRAVVLQSTDGFVGTVTVSGGKLQGANAAITAVEGGNALTLANGVQVQSDIGPLIEVFSTASLETTLDAVDLTGRMQAAAGGTLDVAFRNTATFVGTVENGGEFDLEGFTSWSVTGASDVGSLTHGGTITFADPTAFNTLTVRGDYIGSGGTIALNTQLAGDGAGSDRLHVIGRTNGSTDLAITNRGGVGALTNADGIRVVQIDGASNGTFALAGRVVGGAYDYLLHKGGVADPADGDWYLRSALTPPPVDPPPVDPPPVDPPPVDPPPVDPPPVDPPPVDPPPHVDPERPSHAPVYRPEIGAYLANQVAAHSVFRQRRDDRGVTRVGGIERTAWVRALHNDFRGIAGQSQIESDAQANGLEIGSQFGAWQLGEGLLSLGASLGQADVGTREISNATHYYAFGDVRGNAATVFATWLGDADSPRGLSIDLWAQQADFDMEVRGQGLAIERYDSRANSVSLETGYAFELVGMADRALYFEPQFQVVHTDYDMDAHVEANGTVVRSSADGVLAGRVALRLFGDIVGMRPFVEIGARYHDTRQSIAFDGEAVKLDLAPVVYETTGGLSVEFGKAWRAWGSVSGRRADSTREVEGQLGLAYRW